MPERVHGEAPVRVFVPSHVTGFFSVHHHEDPARTGSRGAGITLSDGVDVGVHPASEWELRVDGEDIAVEAVDRVIAAFDRPARIEIATRAPLGAGFGLSGAMALGTAIGLNAIAETRRTANELARLAHVAEVEAGTGLGDVVAQLRGGVPIRTEPGAPGHGALDGMYGEGEVEYLVLGELSTQEVLGGDVEPIVDAGETALANLLERPTLATFLRESRRFSHDSELLVDEVATVLEEVTAAGGEAAMAMLGRTVFALGDGLSAAGYEPATCRIDHGGARLTADGAVYYPSEAEYET